MDEKNQQVGDPMSEPSIAAVVTTTLRAVSSLLALARNHLSQRRLTPDERANLHVSMAIPAVYTASLGGHARLLLDRTAPPERV
jgi:hypothetical protein